MPLQAVAAYLGDTAHPVELDRAILRDRYRKTGITYFSAFALTTVNGSMALNVGAGRAFLLGEETAQQGGYFVWSDSAQNIPWPAASGQPRIDLLVLRVVDLQYGSDPGISRAEWDIIQGTPASSPSAPSNTVLQFGGPNYKPGAYYIRGTVRVDPGDTDLVGNTITTINEYSQGARRQWTVPTKVDLASIPNGVAFKGDTAFVSGSEREYRMTESGSWLPTQPVIAQKTVDTLRASTTTLFSDVSVYLDAYVRYAFEAMLLYKYDSTPKLRFSMEFPNDAECMWGMHSLDQGMTSSAFGDVFAGAFEFAVSNTSIFTVGGANSGQFMAVIKGSIFMGPTDGNLTVRHAPAVSNAATVGLYKGSTLKATPIAF